MPDIYDQLLDQRIGAPAQTGGDVYDQILDQRQEGETKRLQTVIDLASKFNPDHSAEAMRLARDTGLPVGTVERNREEVARQARVAAMNLQNLTASSPILARQLSDPDFAKIAHDDVDNLSTFERTLGGTLQDAGVVAMKGSIGLVQSLVGLADIPTLGRTGKALDSIGLNFGQAQKFYGDLYSPAQKAANAKVSKASGFLETLDAALQNPSVIATTVGESMPQLLGGGAISRALLKFFPALSAVAAGAIGEGVTGAGSAAEQIRDSSADGTLSAGQSLSAVGSGAGTAALAMLGGSIAQKLGIADIDTAIASGGIGASDLKKGLVRKLAEGGISEGIFEELPQSAQEQIWQNLATDKPLMEGVSNAAAMGMLSGMSMGSAFNAAQYAAEQGERKAVQGAFDTGVIERINELAAASKIVARDAYTFEAFAQSATEDGPREHVYISPLAFNQSGIAEQLAQVSPSIAAQVQDAVQTGRDVQIPFGEYSARIAPTELSGALLDHIKFDPAGFTKTEAHEYMQSGKADELKAEVERVMQQQEAADVFKASREAVKQAVLDNLNTVGRFTPQVNEAQATLAAAYASVRAAKLGVTPEQFFKDHMLTVAGEAIGGQQFNQEQGPFGPVLTDYKGNAQGAIAKLIEMKSGEARAALHHPEIGDIDLVWGEEGRKDGLIVSRVVDYRDPGVTGSKTKTPSTTYAAFNPTQIKSATGNRGTFDPADANILHQSAFHGSPHHFDAFSLEHMGKGEGNQAFGWGLYFAGKKQVAEFYRNALSNEAVFLDGKKVSGLDSSTPEGSALSIVSGQGYEAARKRADSFAMEVEDAGGDMEWVRQWIAEIEKLKDRNVERRLDGQLYEVSIPEDDTMLLWDKPLSEQPEKVREALGAYQFPDAKMDGGEMYAFIRNQLADQAGGGSSKAYYKESRWAEAASKFLNSLGVSGIKYLDGTSRSDGDGSFNYVIFDDNAVEVLRTYYQNKQTNRGSFNPETNLITLLKNADLSTFLHESGHYFFETDIKIASQLAQSARMFGADSLSEGEREILRDVSALFDWNGIKGDIDQQLAQWYGMDFEEKRAYHEKVAESFEAYLFDGKAPSLELQPYFQKFRAWLLSVYKSLKDFVAKNPDAGQLTDEVRGVFDRMLASTEEIQNAERGRNMLPLFETAEQAGMSPEGFAEYHSMDLASSAEAIDELQAKGLRDMQWARNARSRVLKRLQKESAELRRAAEMDARREVMSQPVYQAWAFLTRKLTVADKIEPAKAPKSNPDSVDETADSLFVAIAKLGGLDKDAVLKTWGVDPADKPQSGLFGKPVWRVENGRSLDDMAEALGQYGYLNKDEHGKVDLADFERQFDAELRGDSQYSNAYAPEQFDLGRPGDQVANPAGLDAGRLDAGALQSMGLTADQVALLKARKMVAKDGLHPDIVAELPGIEMTSGDELVKKLLAANDPKDEIATLTDTKMLEQHGELSTAEAIEKAADRAIHNEVRARMVATELNALAKGMGNQQERRVLVAAAKQFAEATVSRLKVRNVRPSLYANAEAKAARAAEKALKAGNRQEALTQKRNQLINIEATRAAYNAQDEIDKGLRYLKKFGAVVKGVDVEYQAQISALLERFDLRQQTLKAIDRKSTLAAWINAQREAGMEPDIPADLENEAFRKPYKNMTVEEFRGLIDTVKQIEHLGRLKKTLLTAKDKREYEAARDEIAASIHEHARDRKANTRSPDTLPARALQKVRQFWASHIKAATWAYVMDGGKDGGPVWEYFVRSANERGDMETTMRAEATKALHDIMAPLLKSGKMQEKKVVGAVGRSFTREARIAIALNVGNEGNLQRLTGGEGWTGQQVAAILDQVTPEEWQAVQAIWDHFESYRPKIAEKEKRIYGKEPDWIEPGSPLIEMVNAKHGLNLRGGYYPIKYDPVASQRAEEHSDSEAAKRQLQGAYTAATTRRSFVKTRAEEVTGRPLLYTLSGVYSGVNDVIHDLSWNEWLIDANRLLRSSTIDKAIRDHYGPEVKDQFKSWVRDIAEGDKGATDAGDVAASFLRQSVSVAGLGFNVMTAIQQPLGFTQSIVRIGPKWAARGISKYIAHPIKTAKQVNQMSSFMENRARTRFRELNELRNMVEGGSATKEFVGKYAYWLMMRFQQAVDVPTWWGAYEKAVASGNNDERSIALADQAVIDSQGGGMTKDLSAIERTGPTGKLFTVFYSFMNSALNMGVAQGMTERSRAKWAANMALLYLVPSVLGYALKNGLTPGDSGDDDPEKLLQKLLEAQIDYMMGTMVYVRELSSTAKAILPGNHFNYQGPAGLRVFADTEKLAQQLRQGDMDIALFKAFVNVLGDLFGLPSAQINRTATGTKALSEWKTQNPAAVMFGYQERH